MEVGCFILLVVIELCVMSISSTLYDIRNILEDIRDSKEGADNDI